MTNGKNIALTIWTFVRNVISAFEYTMFNFSFKAQTSFNFMAGVTVCSEFEAKETKLCHSFHFPPSISHEIIESDAMAFYVSC